jgi:HEAT repeat protein
MPTQVASKKRPNVKSRRIAVRIFPGADRNQLLRAIRTYLKDQSPRVRETALERARDEVLTELNDQVIHLISDKNDFVRQRAIECFGLFHEGEAIKVSWLHSFLRHPNVLTRVETLETLDQIDDKSALTAMVNCLRDDDYLVRAYAAICIAQLGGRKFRKQIEQASKIEEIENAKPWFARSLLLLGDWKQFSKLLGFLSSPSPTARCATANALTEFEWSPSQLKTVLAAVALASKNFLARSDQSTMEKVLKQLLEEVSAPSH